MFSSFLTNPRNRRTAPDGLQHPSTTTAASSGLDEEPTEDRRHRSDHGRRKSTKRGTADGSPNARGSSVRNRSRSRGSPTPMMSMGHVLTMMVIPY